MALTNLTKIFYRFYHSFPYKKNSTPINEKIESSEVMLIDQNGDKQGIVPINFALKSAQDASLDLVQVSASDSNPVVCKLMDYGKHIFAKKKISHLLREKLKKIQ